MNRRRPFTKMFSLSAMIAAALLLALFALGRLEPMFTAFHSSLLILFVPIICLLVCALLLFRGSRLARYGLAFMYGIKAASLFGLSALDFNTHGTPAGALVTPVLLALAFLILTVLLLFSKRLGIELKAARDRMQTEMHQHPT